MLTDKDIKKLSQVFVTKKDLHHLESRLRSDIKASETRLKQEIKDVESNLKDEMKDMEERIYLGVGDMIEESILPQIEEIVGEVKNSSKRVDKLEKVTTKTLN